jgi:hypothetical protein
MLDVRIPIKNRKITLNDVVDMMLDGFNKVNGRLDNLETRMTNVENKLDKTSSLLHKVIKLNNLRTK